LLKPQAPKDIQPASCDLCDLRAPLDYLSAKEVFTDGTIRHYIGWVCINCANEYERKTVEAFKRDNPDYKNEEI
jgi:hypothetical protein